uniref:Reverse transcriptase Ty1/copia-type domain-containing protein n=1 Tax=Davidia involucrata TaxID=16924 RepID=A0A5B6ZCF5_DAVIN
MFVYKRNSHMAILLLYVDDIILTASSTSLLNSLIAAMKGEFAMSDLGHLHYFLGIAATPTDDGIFLSQSKYTSAILQRSNLHFAKPVATPLGSKPSTSSSNDAPYPDPSFYHSIVGALQYLTFT